MANLYARSELPARSDQSGVQVCYKSYSKNNPPDQKGYTSTMLKVRSTYQYHVTFRGCGAELHPAFSSAIQMGNGMFRVSYNVFSPYLEMGQAAQKAWAEDKCAHLKSWGEIGQIGIKALVA